MHALKSQTEQLLDQIDSSGDGKVSVSEWDAYIEGYYATHAERTALFTILDAQLVLTMSRLAELHHAQRKNIDEDGELDGEKDDEIFIPNPMMNV